jgi:hypothetical protein
MIGQEGLGVTIHSVEEAMPYGPERKVAVKVWKGKTVITVCQMSKSVWRASGDYMDESHETKSATAGQAIKAWQLWAHTKGR